MRRILFSMLLLLPLARVYAASTEPKTEVPPPPVITEDDSTKAEPEVRIIQKADNKIEEYRINGHLYMVKVTPTIGAPYYLMDEDGSGSMIQIDPSRRVIVPRWVLMTF